MSWSRAFDDPIQLPDGRELVTLRHAAEYVQELLTTFRRKIRLS
jgi:hypothetical protein